MRKVPDGVVAVKALFSNTDDYTIRNEIEILKSLSTIEHGDDHLIKLLATYEQGGEHHLVFPWAEVDLEGYWKKCSDYYNGDIDYPSWLASQCQGLAMALHKVHKYNTSLHTTTIVDTSKYRGGSIGGSTTLSLYGRHGDIKPANILWFPHEKHGVLKITDFGVTHFKATNTGPTRTPAHSRPYRSPECDLGIVKRSTFCDIWALGCVYLVFITWFFDGHAGIETFVSERRENGNYFPRTENDHFFEIREGVNGEATAYVKESVLRVSVTFIILRAIADQVE